MTGNVNFAVGIAFAAVGGLFAYGFLERGWRIVAVCVAIAGLCIMASFHFIMSADKLWQNGR